MHNKFYTYRILIRCFLVGIVLCNGLTGQCSMINDVILKLNIERRLSKNSVIIPFNSYKGLIILTGKVGDQEGNFVLDTGANGLVLNSKYFESSSLLSRIGYGLSGQTSIVEKRVSKISVDELEIKRLSADLIDLGVIENQKKVRILGLIGYEAIKEFELMLNYKEKYVTFSLLSHNGEILDPLPHTLSKVDSFSFVLGNFIPVIEVTVDDKKKKMGIDTGAEYNLMDLNRNNDVTSNFTISNRIKIASADGREVEALAGRLYRLVLGDRYKCGAMATVFSSLNQFDKIYGMKLDGILGHEFLSPWLFSINYKKKMLYVHQLKFVGP